MTSSNRNDIYAPLQKALLFGVLIGIALVLFGWILIPATNLLSVGAAGLILGVYGSLAYYGFSKIDTEVLRWAGMFGLMAGVIFVGEILLEYIVLPKDNTTWGLIEFGSVFLIYFLSSLWASYRTVRARSGMLTAILSAMLSALIWLITILIMFYVFQGTERQAQVFRAEGTYEDFARSGMTDFKSFVMEDLLGGGFFHLILGPILAAILGSIGSLLGKGIAKIRPPC